MEGNAAATGHNHVLWETRQVFGTCLVCVPRIMSILATSCYRQTNGRNKLEISSMTSTVTVAVAWSTVVLTV